MTGQRPPKAPKGSNRRIAELKAEVAQLRRDLAAAQAQPTPQDGASAPPPPRLAELEEGRHIARG